jgi:hypothetical protein
VADYLNVKTVAMTEALASVELTDLPPHVLNAAVAVAVALGTLYCFLGYRALKAVIAMTGFGLAGAAGGVIAGLVTHGQPLYMVLGVVLAGVCGAVALLVVYRSGIFLVGLLGVALAAHYAAGLWPVLESPLAVLAAGVVGGIVALVVERPAVTLATAALGAWAIIQGVLFFLYAPQGLPLALPSLAREGRTLFLVWLVLAASGAMAQFATYRRPRPQEA